MHEAAEKEKGELLIWGGRSKGHPVMVFDRGKKNRSYRRKKKVKSRHNEIRRKEENDSNRTFSEKGGGKPLSRWRGEEDGGGDVGVDILVRLPGCTLLSEGELLPSP